jgi:hypothetical protein
MDMKNEEKSAAQSPVLLFQTEKGQAYHANSWVQIAQIYGANEARRHLVEWNPEAFTLIH